MIGPDGGTRRLRARALLARWFPAFALVAAVLLLAGGYATYTAHQAPGTVTEERQVANWEGNGTYTTSARVTEPNPLLPVGTELSGRSIYFTAVSPRLNGTFAFEYAASDGGRLDVTVRETLVLRAVEETDGGVVEYWRIDESLGAANESDVPPGEPVEVTFSRNLSRVADRLANVTDRLRGPPGTTEVLVSAEVEVEGEVNGRPVERTGTYRLPIEVQNAHYAPGAVEGEAMTGTTTERVTVERSYGPLWRVGGPAVALLGLVVLGLLGAGRSRDAFALSPRERDVLDHRRVREEFDDWITTARVPTAATTRPEIEVESLEGLVDTAIDTDERVIERLDGSAYYVLHGEYVYVHRPPPSLTTGPSTPMEGADGKSPAESADEGGAEPRGDAAADPDDDTG